VSAESIIDTCGERLLDATATAASSSITTTASRGRPSESWMVSLALWPVTTLFSLVPVPFVVVYVTAGFIMDAFRRDPTAAQPRLRLDSPARMRF
jgi:hypothetical protein